ncbi:sulfatase-like hydrolase/transferase [Mucilaginibacter sp. SP1R1]|uniref:sulfatase-like hydrolase/transferase n=1 Tax=Mucilaginibacter sp. SP1R1 TaxID=2723091 RepID=UPI003B00D594
MNLQRYIIPLTLFDGNTPLNKRYHTPDMERIAKEGTKFTNAYAAPVCTPSRTAMLSGFNPPIVVLTTGQIK